ncbi:MAG TPA: RHS repeat-associated core domain-containing protein [Thermoanaerobaculia bacterium]|nr:RHS repeat-associated core domain-containing protein [Thermoanaerobaculia bacterium]
MKTKILSLLLALASSRIAVAQTPTDSGFPNAARRPTKVFTEAVNWNSGVTYTYDGAGNIRSIGTDAQVYDAAGRLVQSSINGVSWQYSYDAFGNRKTCAGPGTDCQYGMTVARSSNRIDSTGVSYDAAGNMLSLGGRSYTWDAMDVLTSESGNGVNREFVYTADDERIAVYDVGSTWHWSVRDPSGKVLRDFTSQDNGSSLASANWTWVKDYVYRDGLLVASRQKLPGNPTPVTWHYHLDHLGTPRRITTDSDAIIGSHTYYAFGPETSDGLNEPSITRMKFTGHERDLESGGGLVELDYMHARYYGAVLGRFLSVDPVLQIKRAMRSPQLWNRYSYALNNPIVFTDPTGETVYLVTYTTGNTEGDDEFRRAAMTRAAEIQKQKGYDPKKDTVLVRGVATKGDFAQAVKDANALAPKFGRVGEINLYSHSGPRDGPIFQYGQKSQHQFASSDLRMNVNWEWWGSGRFYGCNTGVNFTQNFAKAQGVTAWGYEGFASFSSTQYNWTYPKSSGPLYLIQTTGWSNGGPLGLLGKWSGVSDRAVAMDPDEP